MPLVHSCSLSAALLCRHILGIVSVKLRQSRKTGGRLYTILGDPFAFERMAFQVRPRSRTIIEIVPLIALYVDDVNECYRKADHMCPVD